MPRPCPPGEDRRRIADLHGPKWEA
jgi:hypothetical protein